MSGRGRRRHFSRQFKADIVKQMLRGASVAQLSQWDGIKPGALYRWRNEAERVLDAAPVADAAQQSKIRKLEREVSDLKEQRMVFKMAFGGASPRNASKCLRPLATGACRLSRSRMPWGLRAARFTMRYGRRAQRSRRSLPGSARFAASIRPSAGAKWLRSWLQMPCPSAKSVLPSSYSSTTWARSA